MRFFQTASPLLLLAGVIGLTISEDIIPKPRLRRQTSSGRNSSSAKKECTSAGFFQDESSSSDCRQFWRCVELEDGSKRFRKYHYECAKGTIFDPETTQCNYPEQINPKPPCYVKNQQDHVAAGTEQQQQQQRPPNKPSGDDGECSEEGFFGQPGNCQGFIRCVPREDGGYTKYSFDCPPGTIFDDEIGICNHPWAVSQTSRCSGQQAGPIGGGGGSSGGSDDNVGQETQGQQQTQRPSSTTQRPDKPQRPQQQRPTPPPHQRPSQSRPPPPQQQQPSSKPCVCDTNPISEGGSDGTGAAATGDVRHEGGSDCVCKPEEEPEPQPSPDPVVDQEEEECVCPPGDNVNPVSEGGSDSTSAIHDEGNRKKGNGGNCVCKPQEGQQTPKPKPPRPSSTTPKPGSGGCTGKPQNSTCGQNPQGSRPPPSPSQGCSEEGFHPVDCNRFIRCVDFGGSLTKFDFECGPGTMFHPALITCVHPWQMPAESDCQSQGPAEVESKPGEPCDNATDTTSPSSTPAPSQVTDKPRPTQKPTQPPNQQRPTARPTQKPSTQKPTQKPPAQRPPPPRPTQKPSTTTTTKRPTQRPSRPPPTQKPPQRPPTQRPTRPSTSPRPTQPSATEQPTTEGAGTTPQDQNMPEHCTNPVIECATAGFFSNPSDCTKFYRCVDFLGTEESFTIFHFDCGPGTVFDETISVCNHPWAVQPDLPCTRCGGSQPQNATTGTDCGQSTTTEIPPEALEQSTPTTAGTTDSSTTPTTQGSTEPSTTPTTEITSTQPSTTPTTELTSTQPSTTPTTMETSTQPSTTEGSTTPGTTVNTGTPPTPESVIQTSTQPSTTEGSTTPPTTQTEASTTPASTTLGSTEPSTTPGSTTLGTTEPSTTPGSTTLGSTEPSTTPGSTTLGSTEPSTTPGSTTLGSTEPSTTPGSTTLGSTEPSTTPGSTTTGTTPTEQTQTTPTPESIMQTTTMCPTYITESGSTMSVTPITMTTPMPTTQASTTTYRPVTTPASTQPTTTQAPTTTMASTTQPPTTTTEASTTTETPTTTTEMSTTTGEPTTTTEPPEIPEFLINCRGGSGSQTLRPHPLDCTKYYTCHWIEGAFVIKVEKCKNDNVFVQDKQKCLDKSKAPECKNETITTTEEHELKKCERIIENHKRQEQQENPPPAALTGKNNGSQGTTGPADFSDVTQFINPDNSCPDEGIYGIRNDCYRFYKCVRNRSGVLINLLMKCPTFYKFHAGRCMKESSLQKMGVVCTNEDPLYGRSSLEDVVDQPLTSSSYDGLPVIHFNPELVEDGSDLLTHLLPVY